MTRHRCAFCRRRFWRFGGLMRHICHTHQNEIPSRNH